MSCELGKQQLKGKCGKGGALSGVKRHAHGSGKGDAFLRYSFRSPARKGGRRVSGIPRRLCHREAPHRHAPFRSCENGSGDCGTSPGHLCFRKETCGYGDYSAYAECGGYRKCDFSGSLCRRGHCFARSGKRTGDCLSLRFFKCLRSRHNGRRDSGHPYSWKREADRMPFPCSRRPDCGGDLSAWRRVAKYFCTMHRRDRWKHSYRQPDGWEP